MKKASFDLLDPKAWSGVWTALVTPFKTGKQPDTVELDTDSLAKLIDDQVSRGIHGLVIAGSTGEGSLLQNSQYESLLRAAFDLTKNRVPLVAGLGIGGTQNCLRNLSVAKSIGYSGVLASAPAYIKAPQRGLKAHFLRLAREGVPVCLYEIAGRAAASIEVPTLAELAQSKEPGASNLVALKDASANLQRALDTQRLCGDRFALLSGDDGTFQAFMAAGGTGVISVVSHLVPRSLNRILQDMKSGNIDRAREEQNRINPLVEALFWESNPVPVKSLLHRLGFVKDEVFSSPLVPMTLGQLEKLSKLAQTIKDAT